MLAANVSNIHKFTLKCLYRQLNGCSIGLRAEMGVVGGGGQGWGVGVKEHRDLIKVLFITPGSAEFS